MKNIRQKSKKQMFVLSLGVFFILFTILSINNPINNNAQTIELDQPYRKINLSISHPPIHNK